MPDPTPITIDLGDFEGLPVRRVGVELPSAAGGLRDAIKVEPRIIHQGDEGVLLIRYQCQKVRFDPIDKDEPDGDQERVHVLKVVAAMFDDEASSEQRLLEHQAKVARAKEADKGTQRLPDDKEVAALLEEHDQGEHADGLRGGCPQCDDEAEASQDEQGAA